VATGRRVPVRAHVTAMVTGERAANLALPTDQ